MSLANKCFVLAIILILLLIYFLPTLKHSAYNTKGVAPCRNCETYQVHRAHDDTEDAAKLMSEITKRNSILIEHLEKKYLRESSTQIDPEKNNRIDVIPKSELLDMSVLAGGGGEEQIPHVQERIEQLVRNYNPKKIYEISPRNSGNATSYTEDKKVLVLCLRHKQPDANGHYRLHDINTMMFVVLHELTHMANKSWGHQIDFWTLFKFLLSNATEIGIYYPINFKTRPMKYCGLGLHYNPLYDF
jgi:predicted metal-dependent hydrolase